MNYGVVVMFVKLFILSVIVSRLLVISLISIDRLCRNVFVKWLIVRIMIVMMSVIVRNDSLLNCSFVVLLLLVY